MTKLRWGGGGCVVAKQNKEKSQLLQVYEYPAVQMKIESVELTGHSSHVTNVAFTQDGNLISVGK